MRRSNELLSATATTPAAPLAITKVIPATNWPLADTLISGTGFESGMKVWFGGIPVPIDRMDSDGIHVTSPAAGSGTVDVRVARSDGQTRVLRGGFTYRTPTIGLSKHQLAAGEMLTVTWTGPGAVRCWPMDHVGLYPAGVMHTPPMWYVELDEESGSRQLAAPAHAGHYEFRYVVESHLVFARASITVR